MLWSAKLTAVIKTNIGQIMTEVAIFHEDSTHDEAWKSTCMVFGMAFRREAKRNNRSCSQSGILFTVRHTVHCQALRLPNRGILRSHHSRGLWMPLGCSPLLESRQGHQTPACRSCRQCQGQAFWRLLQRAINRHLAGTHHGDAPTRPRRRCALRTSTTPQTRCQPCQASNIANWPPLPSRRMSRMSAAQQHQDVESHALFPVPRLHRFLQRAKLFAEIMSSIGPMS